MVTIDGNWTMEGLDRNDPDRIKTSDELTGLINDLGFLPLFKNRVTGFSVEELTAAAAWWSGGIEDPWSWREIIAGEGKVAYGKLFLNRAGFVSKEWYPVFAAFRRDGYDFDSRYEDGLASYRAKRIMDIMTENEELPSYEIKRKAGFGKDGEKGFEGVMTALQMQTYLTVRYFKRKENKKGEEYGWPVSVYSVAEGLFGEEYVRSAYHLSTQAAKEKIMNHLIKRFPKASCTNIAKCIQ